MSQLEAAIKFNEIRNHIDGVPNVGPRFIPRRRLRGTKRPFTGNAVDRRLPREQD